MTKKATPKSSEMIGIMCENLFRSIFGDRKYHGYASAFNNPTFRKKELEKLLDKFLERADELNASEKFKEYLTYQLKYLKTELSRMKLDVEATGLLLINLKLIATFFGYHFAAGSKTEDPYFIPSIWAEKQGWLESLTFYNERDALIEKRQKLVEKLQKDGHTLSEIAFMLNISGYKVAQISQKIISQKN